MAQRQTPILYPSPEGLTVQPPHPASRRVGKLDAAAKVTLPAIAEIAGLELHLITDMEAAAQPWRRFQQRAWYTPFQDFDWVSSWYQHAGKSAQISPAIVFGYADNELQLILPLMVEKRFGVKSLAWMAGAINDYNAVLIDRQLLARLSRAEAEAILEATAAALGDIDMRAFLQQPALLDGCQNPFLNTDAPASSCASHLMSLERDWRGHYAQLRSSKSRRRLREKEKKLKRSGALRFCCIREPVARMAALRQILNWKSGQLDALGSPNTFAGSSAENFSPSDLAQTMQLYGQCPASMRDMRIYGLLFDGRLIAGMVAFVGNGVFSLFTTAYDADAPANSSPGAILLVKTMELAARAGLDTYDFLAGDEAYKFDWCDQHLALHDDFTGLSLTGKLDGQRRHWQLRVKKHIKANASLMQKLQSLNTARIKLLRG